MLANLGRGLQVELIQGNDAIKAPASRHPGNGVQNLLAIQAGRHGDHFLQRLAGPGRVAQMVQGKQRGLYSHPRALAQKIVPVLIAGKAKKPFELFGHRPLF